LVEQMANSANPSQTRTGAHQAAVSGPRTAAPSSDTTRILPHRKRMQAEDPEAKFKNPDDPLRLVFVCAMWITGFDVPSIGTVYINKPMKNHTLMQTIARANRRAEGKTAGVIVDYVGVFRSLERALAIYAGSGGAGGDIQAAG